jgi:hypothetical protein
VRHVPASFAIDVGPLGVGPTPLAILVTVLVVGLVLVAVLVVGSQVAGPLVDKRWPANEPLTPSEVLWAETGSHVSKSFPGLDPVLARDLTQYIHSRKVGPGTVVVEAGDLPTEFVLLKSGSAEVQEAGGTRQVKAGASFGSDNILRRLPHQATVRTTSPAELVTLDAQDYLAAVALGMSDDDDDYVVHALAGVLGGTDTGVAPAPTQVSAPVAAPPPSSAAPPAPAPPVVAQPPAPPAPPTPAPPTSAPPTAAAPSTPAPPSPAPPTAAPPTAAPPTSPAPPAAPRWPAATHVVVVAELAGYVLPAGDTPTRVLPAGTAVAAIEDLPGWVHVRTVDGWQGWVSSSGLGRG